MFFARGETPLIRKVEERLARWIMVPVSHGEGIQVLRYAGPWTGLAGAAHLHHLALSDTPS